MNYLNNFRKNKYYEKKYNNIIENFTQPVSEEEINKYVDLFNLDPVNDEMYKSVSSIDQLINSWSSKDKNISTRILNTGIKEMKHLLEPDSLTMINDAISQYQSNLATRTADAQHNANQLANLATRISREQQPAAFFTDQSIGTEDYDQRYLNYSVSQDALAKIDEEYVDVINTGMNVYNSDTLNYNSLNQLKNRNQYIQLYNDNLKQQRSGVSNKLNSDIQTKERYVQISRYEYLKKRKIIKYCQFFSIVFVLGSICYIVGTQYEDENIRNLLKIITLIIYVIAAIFLFFMIKSDSKRYMLDWDEIYYSGDQSNWKDTSKLN